MVPTGTGGRRSRSPARPLRDPGPRAWWGDEEARAGARGWPHSPTSRWAGARRPRSPGSEAPLRDAGGCLRGPQGWRRRASRVQPSLALTPPARSRVPAPASSLPPAPPGPLPPKRARRGRREPPGRLERDLGTLAPCPCSALPSGDVRPAPRHGALLYASRSSSRWPCRAPARGLSPCARWPRCAPEPSGRGPARVARPKNSMQRRPPPLFLPGGLPGIWGAAHSALSSSPPPPPPPSLRVPGFGARLGCPYPSLPNLGYSEVAEPLPAPLRLSNGSPVSRQHNLRNASPPRRARTHALHTLAHEGGTRAGAWQTVLLPFLPHPTPGKLPTLTPATAAPPYWTAHPKRPIPAPSLLRPGTHTRQELTPVSADTACRCGGEKRRGGGFTLSRPIPLSWGLRTRAACPPLLARSQLVCVWGGECLDTGVRPRS